MKTKKKAIAVISIILILIIIFVCVFLHIVSISIKADELSQLDNWQQSITYSMFSDKLKLVISEEEFNDRTDEGRYNMYSKLEGLELEKRTKNDPSTDWWKTPPCDSITIGEDKYFIEYRIDFKVRYKKIEVINFVTYLSEY